jgi:Trk-type K+ transport system membrane component
LIRQLARLDSAKRADQMRRSKTFKKDYLFFFLAAFFFFLAAFFFAILIHRPFYFIFFEVI